MPIQAFDPALIPFFSHDHSTITAIVNLKTEPLDQSFQAEEIGIESSNAISGQVIILTEHTCYHFVVQSRHEHIQISVLGYELRYTALYSRTFTCTSSVHKS